MSETQFLQAIDTTLARVQAAVDAAGLPVECSQTALILTLELDDGAKVILNAQTPMRQLWMASRIGARHFALQGEEWRDTRSGAEFFGELERTLAELLGEPVQLARR